MDNEIETLVKTTIQTKIVLALKETPEAIDKLVQAALSKPVDPSSGQQNGYGTKVPYLDYLVGDLIREAARMSAREIIRESEAEITAAVRKRLTTDNLAEAITRAVIGSAEEEWKIGVSFEKQR